MKNLQQTHNHWGDTFQPGDVVDYRHLSEQGRSPAGTITRISTPDGSYSRTECHLSTGWPAHPGMLCHSSE